jgi:chromosomal replication initiation ATPase DnaA
MPIGVLGDLLDIGRQPGQPTPEELRNAVDDRMAQLDSDLTAAQLPTGKPAELKDDLRQRISDALAAPVTQPDLNMKIVFLRALEVRNGEA